MAIERRDFMRLMVGGIAGAFAVRTWPFRIYSFPSEVWEGTTVPRIGLLDIAISRYYEKDFVRKYFLEAKTVLENIYHNCPLPPGSKRIELYTYKLI